MTSFPAQTIPFKRVFLLAFYIFILFFLSFFIAKPSFALIACDQAGQTCDISDAAWNGATCISSGVPTQCNYIWGTKTAQGDCYDSSGNPTGNTCERTQSCCVPGQNGCPCSVTCTGSSTGSPGPDSCLGVSGWKSP